MNEEKLLENLLKAGDRERAASKKKQAAELKKAEKRKIELDNMFARMYEDWAADASRKATSVCSRSATRQSRRSLS